MLSNLPNPCMHMCTPVFEYACACTHNMHTHFLALSPERPRSKTSQQHWANLVPRMFFTSPLMWHLIPRCAFGAAVPHPHRTNRDFEASYWRHGHFRVDREREWRESGPPHSTGSLQQPGPGALPEDICLAVVLWLHCQAGGQWQ